MDIMVTLTSAEQALLLVNEYNDGPDTEPDAWSTIARKIRAAQSIEPGTYCTCCLDNECECSGAAISGSAAPLGDAARAVIAGLVASRLDVNPAGITADDDVWTQIRNAFPLDLFITRPEHGMGYDRTAGE